MEWQSGIDSVAHNTTLESNGKTIAVLGCGFKNIFPKENEGLFYKIIENGGLIISEYEPEKKATSEKFLERNRIVSGIALGILVIESAHRSGTSVTARIAKEQGKKVMAIPHGIYEKTGVGNNRLIKNEIAIMVRTTKDIIEELSNVKYKEIREIKENIKKRTNKENKKINKDRKKDKNKNENTNIIKNIKTNDKINTKQKSKNSPSKKKTCNNKIYNEIYQFISDTPCTLNEIYKKANKSISEINNILLMLELEGYIEKVARGYRCTKNK